MGRYGSTDPGASSPSSSSVPVGVPVLLLAEEVMPDRNTFEGADEPQVRIKWVSQPDEAWVWDRISLWHVRDQKNGSPSKAKQLGAALAGRVAAQVGPYWIDDDTWEFGFDSAKQEVQGQLQQGMKVAAELVRRPDSNSIERLRVSRYLPISMLPGSVVNNAPVEAGRLSELAQEAQPAQVSPDGAWRWDGKQWVPAQVRPSTTGGRLI